jgi:hypothetical protein
MNGLAAATSMIRGGGDRPTEAEHAEAVRLRAAAENLYAVSDEYDRRGDSNLARVYSGQADALVQRARVLDKIKVSGDPVPSYDTYAPSRQPVASQPDFSSEGTITSNRTPALAAAQRARQIARQKEIDSVLQAQIEAEREGRPIPDSSGGYPTGGILAINDPSGALSRQQQDYLLSLALRRQQEGGEGMSTAQVAGWAVVGVGLIGLVALIARR